MNVAFTVDWDGDPMEEFARLKRVPLTKVLRNAGRDFVGTGMRMTPRSTFEGFLKPLLDKLELPGGFYNGSRFADVEDEILSGYSGKRRTKHSSPLERLKHWKALFPVLKGISKQSWTPAAKALGMRGAGRKYSTAPRSSATWTDENAERGEGPVDICLTISQKSAYGSPKFQGLPESILDAGLAKAADSIMREWQRMSLKGL